MTAKAMNTNPLSVRLRKLAVTAAIAATLASLQACTTAAQHYQELAATQDRALTVGLVQRDIVKGLPASSVASRLGSPNIVTRDVDGRETWIYDKVASEASFSQGTFTAGGGLFGSAIFPSAGTDPAGSLSASISANNSKSAGAASVTQRTLTVVIKFDPSQQVDSVNYHSTKF